MLRQTRKSLAQSVMLTFERDVLPPGYIENPGSSREHRSSYRYPNGSEIVCGGLDDPYKWDSGEFDLIYIAQAEQCREEAIEILKKRLSNFAHPDNWVQLLMDANTRSNAHWLKQRIDRGQTLMVKARWRDNPKYCQGTGALPPSGMSPYWTGQAWTENGVRFLQEEGWTAEGIAYLGANWGASGHIHDRLMLGLWANPEGMRFKNASRDQMAFDFYKKFPNGMPPAWLRWLSVDWGRASPYCCLWHASEPGAVENYNKDQRIYTYQEDYSTGFGSDEQAQRIVDASPAGERYEYVMMDPSMWSKEKSFGANEEGKPAVEIYTEVFERANKELGYKKFGPCIKGAGNHQEVGFDTLDYKLRNGTWNICMDCGNLWNELEDAVHYQDPTTGIFSELVNPNSQKKVCPDHALESAVIGIHKHTPKSTQPPSKEIDYIEVYKARQAEREAASAQRNRPKPTTRFGLRNRNR